MKLEKLKNLHHETRKMFTFALLQLENFRILKIYTMKPEKLKKITL